MVWEEVMVWGGATMGKSWYGEEVVVWEEVMVWGRGDGVGRR